MRAVLVAASPSSPPPELLHRLAEEADLIIAVDGGAVACERARVIPHHIVGDLDSTPDSTLQWLRRESVETHVLPMEKDESDLDAAFVIARSLGATEIMVSGVTGGRLDHELCALGTLARHADLAPEVREALSEAWILAAPGRTNCVIDDTFDEFSLVALGGVATVTCEGARWNLECESLAPLSSRGLSNRRVVSEAIVTLLSGTLLVVAHRAQSLIQ